MRKTIWIIILIILLGVAIWGCGYSLNKYNKSLNEIKDLEKENKQLEEELKKAKDEKEDCPEIEEDEKDNKEENKDNKDEKEDKEEKVVVYPDFTTGNYGISEVQDFCNKYDLELEVTYNEPDGTQIPGGKMPKEDTVFVQMPAAGEKVVKGDTLTITIARY